MSTVIDGVHVITDAELDEWAIGAHAGHANSVGAFRPLTPQQRYIAYGEAQTRMNFTGERFSACARGACKDVAAGRTPYRDQAEAYRKIEAAKSPEQRTAETMAALRHAQTGAAW